MSERCPVKKVRQNGYSLARVLVTSTATASSIVIVGAHSLFIARPNPLFSQFLSVCGTPEIDF